MSTSYEVFQQDVNFSSTLNLWPTKALESPKGPCLSEILARHSAEINFDVSDTTDPLDVTSGSF